MALAEFEKVVLWCQMRKFNVKEITAELLKSDESSRIFGGAGGFLGQVVDAPTNEDAIVTFCKGWSLEANIQSFAHIIKAAKEVGDTDFAKDLEEKYKKCLNAQGSIYFTALTELPDDETMISESEYVSRPELEEEIKARTMKLGSDRGILLVHGDGGIGKTTLLRWVLTRKFLSECGFTHRVWLNVYVLSKSPDFESEIKLEDRVFSKIAELLKADEPLQRHLEKQAKEGTKLLLVLDDVFNEQLLKCVRKLPDNVRIIFISRRNVSLKIPKLFSQCPIHVGEMSEESICSMFSDCNPLVASHDLKYLVKLCSGLALVAQVIKAQLLRCGTSKTHAGIYIEKVREQFPHLLHENAEDDDEREEAVRKLLVSGFADEPAEFLRKYCAFLLFDEASDVDFEDLSILWQCDNISNASSIALDFCNRALVRSNKEKTKFSIHAYLFGAALEFLAIQEKDKSNADLTSCLVPYHKRNEEGKIKCLAAVRKNLLLSTMKSENGENALHLAAKRQRATLLRIILATMREDRENKLLLDLCSQPSSKTQGHRLPLQLLLESNWQINGRNFGLDVVCFLADRLLLQERSRAEVLLNSSTNDQNLSVLELLLDNVKNSRDGKWHENALLLCAGRGYRELLILLIDNGASKNSHDESGNNALLIAANNCKAHIVFELLERDKDFDRNYRNKKGTTALMISSFFGDNSSCEQLLKSQKIDINARNNSGNTALILAAKNGKISTAKRLMQTGANVKIRNEEGDSALWLALLNEKIEVAELIHENNGEITRGELFALSIRTRFQNKHRTEELLRKWGEDLAFPKEVDFETAVSPLLKLIGIKRPTAGLDCARILQSIYNDDRSQMQEQWKRLNEDNKNTAVQLAAYFGSVELLEIFDNELKQNGKERENLILMGAMNGHHTIVSYLISHGVNVNAKGNNNDVTPLFMASQNGHAELVKLLLQHNADVNAKKNDGVTPIFMASLKGHVEVVKLLLDHNADVIAMTSDDVTPLLMASQNGHVEVVKLLMDHTTDVNAKRSDDVTPLLVASQNGHVEVVKLLLERNADVNAKTSYDETPLSRAIQNGHVEIVKLLLEHNADIKAMRINGVAPLLRAIQNGHVEIVKLLLEHNGDVKAKTGDDETPLWMAIENGHVEIVKLLLEHNADVNAKRNYCTTPLLRAIQNGHVEIVKLLLEYNACVNAKSSYDETPLLGAIQNGHVEIVKLLLEYNADVNAMTSYEDTPLLRAIQNGHVEIVQLLLAHKADVNAWKNDHVTPILMASQNGHAELVKLLLEHNADVNVKTSYDVTPLLVASQNGHVEVKKLLLHYQAVQGRGLSRGWVHGRGLVRRRRTTKVAVAVDQMDDNSVRLQEAVPSTTRRRLRNDVKRLVDADISSPGPSAFEPIAKRTRRSK